MAAIVHPAGPISFLFDPPLQSVIRKCLEKTGELAICAGRGWAAALGFGSRIPSRGDSNRRIASRAQKVLIAAAVCGWIAAAGLLAWAWTSRQSE
jgi:hypothetical protein